MRVRLWKGDVSAAQCHFTHSPILRPILVSEERAPLQAGLWYLSIIIGNTGHEHGRGTFDKRSQRDWSIEAGDVHYCYYYCYYDLNETGVIEAGGDVH